MNVRDRAWRRRKTRRVLAKVNSTKAWLIRQFEGITPKRPPKELKAHRVGKLTHAQALRQHWALNQELRDGIA
ncbi:MAG TPA: hypothetical protein VG944_18025 [Fimbriimonas sp.]|nr:hypothetical protein [Fimbriimonas sp.]